MSDEAADTGRRRAVAVSDPGLVLKGVEVYRVRRRVSRIAAQAALGLVVWPVIAVVILQALDAVLGDLGRQAGDLLLTGWALSWLAGAPVAMIVSLVASLQRRVPADSLSVKGGALEMPIAGALGHIPLSRIEGAIVRAPAGAEREAEVALKSGDVLFVRAKRKGPDALVESLGFSGAKRRTVVPLGGVRSPLWSTLAAVVLGLVLAPLGTCATVAFLPSSTAGDVFLSLLGIAFVLVTMVTARVMTPRKLVIGADGVELHGAFRRRFFPRSQILGAEKIRRDVTLLLRDGDGVKDVRLSKEEDDRRSALAKCICDALEDPAHGPDPRAALLARGTDEIGAWRERVKKLVGPSEGYRRSAIPVETLVRAVSDPEAPADVRVGAAMAIGSSGDPEAKAQLRIATNEIVDEDLRVAIETAAEDEAADDAIQAACSRATRRP